MVTAKKISKPKTSLTAVLIVIGCTLFTSFGQYLVKSGLNRASSFIGILNFYFISGLIAYGLGAIIFILALRGASLSVLYPIFSLGFIWVAFLGVYFFGEKLLPINWAGIIFIVIGVSLVGAGAQVKNG